MDNEPQDISCPTCNSFPELHPSLGYNVSDKTLFQLVRSGKGGCIICAALVETLVRCVPGVDKGSDGRLGWQMYHGTLRLRWLYADRQSPIWLDLFQIHYKHVPVDTIRVGRAPSGYTGSTLALERAVEWITECTTKHELCGDGSSAVLPSRVLDLGSRDSCLEVRIVTGQARSSRYGTLSHCWGQQGNHRVLTKATYNSWLQSFSVKELPQTYQDAVVVAKRLGLQYLWIDSLCIIQDDENDWRVESSKMAEIYQYSYITIAATCAADSSTGMFSTARHMHRPEAIPYRAGGIEPQVYASVSLPHHAGHPIKKDHLYYDWIILDSPEMPLVSRAWFYQERMLSPRILHFMKEELIFECLDGNRCECKVFPSQGMCVKPIHVKSLNKDVALKFPSSGGAIWQNWSTSGLPIRWRQIVGEYTLLSLTFEKDRLTAISGVVAQMRRYRNDPRDPYIAGLWGSTFIEDLCWHTFAAIPKLKPEVWRAPSWSWAAVNDSVNYHYTVQGQQSAELHRVVCNHFVIENLKSDESGELESGWAEISGFLCNGTLNRTSSVNSHKKEYRLRIDTSYYLLKEIFSDIFLDHNIDHLELGTGSIDVSCITLFDPKESTGIHDYDPAGDHGVVLLLQKVSNEIATYERIGMLYSVGDMFPKSSSKTRIKLI